MRTKLAIIGAFLAAMLGMSYSSYMIGKRAADKWYVNRLPIGKIEHLEDFDSVVIGWDVEGNCFSPLWPKVRVLSGDNKFHDSTKPCKLTALPRTPQPRASSQEPK